jgi:hypothetical protein
MFVIWWRLPGSPWNVYADEMFWDENAAVLRIPLVLERCGGIAECQILPTDKRPDSVQ